MVRNRTAQLAMILLKMSLPINLEIIYRGWISAIKTRPRLAAAYVGVFRSGKIKIRGLEIRRSKHTAVYPRRSESNVSISVRQAY
jgi:hypothetical protein